MLRQVFGICVLAVFAGPLMAQMSVGETFRVCGISAEPLAIAECVSSDFAQLVASAEVNLAGRLELETRRDAWADAKVVKQQMLNLLSDPDQSTEYETLLASLQEASSDVELARSSYYQYIEVMREALIIHLTVNQQAKFQLAIRADVQGLPPEYRVLDWDSRRITHLSRALRMVDSGTVNQHPLIAAAESNYEVQYAKQMLIVHLESLEAALAAL